MASIVVHRVTKASPAQVWELLSDLTRWPEWMPSVQSVAREAPDGPDGMGAAYLVKQPRLRQARWVVTEWLPEQGFTWQSGTPGISTTGVHELTARADTGTEITLEITWTGPLAWLARIMYGRMTRRYIEAEADALAERSRIDR